ncbi:MAG: GNAT family N-acetyltransferase [Acidimicrobiales bacterium]
MNVTIRPAQPEDGEALRTIERLAGERFREVGLDAIADDEPDSVEALASYALDGRSWVAIDTTGLPVGYVLVDVVDGSAHVEQVSVVPQRQGQGVGRALLERVGQWAIATHRSAITLTTFADVAWNRPLYEHLGFRVMSDAEIGSELRQIRETEASHGLDPATRVCMRLDLPN